MRATVVAAGIVAAATVAALVALQLREAPLSGTEPGIRVGIHVRPGQVAATSLPLPAFEGSGHAVLDSLRLTDPGRVPRGTRVYTAVLRASERGYIGGLRGWPNRLPGVLEGYRLWPVAGFRVRRGDQLALVVGASIPQPGCYRLKRFTLTYGVGLFTYGTNLRNTELELEVDPRGRSRCSDPEP